MAPPWVILLLTTIFLVTNAQLTEVTEMPSVLEEATESAEEELSVACNISLGCPEDSVTFGDTPKAPPPVKVDYASWIIVTTIFIVGLCGNSLTVVIMRRKAFRHMSMSLILIALSISDTTIIAMTPFSKMFFLRAVGWDIRGISVYHCKIFFFIWRVAKMTSSWFVVLISMERVVAVALPFHAKKINSRKNIIGLIVLVYLAIGTFDLVWGCFADIVQDGFCRPNKSLLSPAVESGLVVAGTMLYSVIPALLIMIINGTTIVHIGMHARKRQQMTSEANDGGKEARTNAMLISVGTAFLVLVTPISIAHTYTVISGINFFKSTDPSVSIMREIVQTLEQLNYATNFFMYVSFSEAYRKELAAITGIKCVAGTPRTKNQSQTTIANAK